MRISAQEPRLQPHLVQQRSSAVTALGVLPANTVHSHRLSERLLDGEARIE